jgi:hypothetical protein
MPVVVKESPGYCNILSQRKKPLSFVLAGNFCRLQSVGQHQAE